MDLIGEQIGQLNENLKPYINSSSDHANNSLIRLILERKPSGNTAWYRLESDGWFRRYWNPGKGYGLMLRGIKIKEKPRYDTYGVWHPMTCKFLPNHMVDYGEDVKSNWEHSYGFIVMNREVHEQFVIESSTRELESYLNGNIRKYKP